MALQVITSITEMQQTANRLRFEGKTIALVPTMGYLHQGHVSLLLRARTAADIVVVSIFVNPTQFGPTEDFGRYPRDFERDKRIAGEAGADIIFAPDVHEMYPAGYSTMVETGEVAQRFEGAFRPTHFRGVTTVVAKLFNITKPHLAFFGQKDAQQAFIIRKMTRELNFDVQIIVAPIVRESDGLAMSSRNTYLAPPQRTRATALFRALSHAKQRILEGENNPATVRSEMLAILAASQPTQIDYIAFIDPSTFEELPSLEYPEILIALAVRYGTTRLIDNIHFHRSEKL